MKTTNVTGKVNYEAVGTYQTNDPQTCVTVDNTVKKTLNHFYVVNAEDTQDTAEMGTTETCGHEAVQKHACHCHKCETLCKSNIIDDGTSLSTESNNEEAKQENLNKNFATNLIQCDHTVGEALKDSMCCSSSFEETAKVYDEGTTYPYDVDHPVQKEYNRDSTNSEDTSQNGIATSQMTTEKFYLPPIVRNAMIQTAVQAVLNQHGGQLPMSLYSVFPADTSCQKTKKEATEEWKSIGELTNDETTLKTAEVCSYEETKSGTQITQHQSTISTIRNGQVFPAITPTHSDEALKGCICDDSVTTTKEASS